MNARELAASKALYKHNSDVAGEPLDLPVDEFDCCAVEALRVADKVDADSGVYRVQMLDKDMVEDLAMTLTWLDAKYFPLTKKWEDDRISEEEKDVWREKARAILWYLRKEAL